MAFYKMKDERVARILEAARLGVTYEQAAKCGGISRKTLWDWLRRGRDEIDAQDDAEEEGKPIPALGPRGRFVMAWEKAETEAQIEAILRVRLAARDPRNWKAVARFMAWRWPETWGTPAAQRRIRKEWEKEIAEMAKHGPKPQVVVTHIGLEEMDPDDPLIEKMFTGPDY